MNPPDEPPRGARAWWLIAVVVIVTVALVGSFVEIFHNTAAEVDGRTRADLAPVTRVAPSVGPGEVAPAVTYTELRTTRRGPNATWQSHIGTLSKTQRAPETAESYVRDHAAAVTARAERRAYDGAPPTIPHPIEARNVGACLACHSNGMDIAGIQAPAMSHPAYTSCTQCHAPSTTAVPVPPGLTVESRFVGAHASGTGGARAWAGAPPTIPHPTWMRETCASCHGPGGAAGLRTTHPERQSCTQCHAPSAAFDQRLPLGGL